MEFFKHFPQIIYNDHTVKNILTSISLNDLVKVTAESYYPYTIDAQDEAWMIASDYYGSAGFVWLVYMSNNIVDPYYEWYMDTEKFERYLAKKYGSIATAQATVVHYKEVITGTETGRIVSKDTYTYLPASANSDLFGVVGNLLPVYAYDYEDELNESRRVIKLLNNIYAEQASENLKELLTK